MRAVEHDWRARLRNHGAPWSSEFRKAVLRSLVDSRRVDVIAIDTTRALRRPPDSGVTVHAVRLRDVRDTGSAKPVRQHRHSFRRSRPLDHDALAIVPPEFHRSALASSRVADVCYIAEVEKQFAGWVWLTYRSHRDPFSGLRFRLGPGDAYTFNLFIVSRYRSAGVGAVLMLSMIEDTRISAGTERLFGWVDRDNRTSQALLRLVCGGRTTRTLVRMRALRAVGFPLPGSTKGGKRVPPRGERHVGELSEHKKSPGIDIERAR